MDLPGVHVRRGRRVEVAATPQVWMAVTASGSADCRDLAQSPAVVEVLPEALTVCSPEPPGTVITGKSAGRVGANHG